MNRLPICATGWEKICFSKFEMAYFEFILRRLFSMWVWKEKGNKNQIDGNAMPWFDF